MILATVIASGIASLTSAMSFITTDGVFSGLIGILVALGTVGGLVGIFRR